VQTHWYTEASVLDGVLPTGCVKKLPATTPRTETGAPAAWLGT
jgi:hypothetical protein